MEESDGKSDRQEDKCASYNHVEKYKNSFLQFGHNNVIITYFTNGKNCVAKEMNRALLEKVRYLLFNAQLDKSFSAEAIVYDSHLLNRPLMTAIGGKTPLDIWSSGAARDFSLLRVFGLSDLC